MTEYKTMGGERYMFQGSKQSAAAAEEQADKYRRQGRLVRVSPEERVCRHITSGCCKVYAIYTRSK